MKALSLLLLMLVLARSLATASLTDDLRSPQQSVRDKAAAELRATFHGTPEAKWTPVIQQIKQGQTKKQILDLLRPFNVTAEEGMGSGQSHSQTYRLDNEWILVCSFQNDGDILFDHKLIPSLRHIWVLPPEDFTGIWVVYFVNGQVGHRINYRNGRYFGEFIAYRSDGSKTFVQHYTAKGADGEDTGYYPSGKISYRAQYQSGKPVGTWTWYDEAGNITSTKEHGGHQ